MPACRIPGREYLPSSKRRCFYPISLPSPPALGLASPPRKRCCWHRAATLASTANPAKGPPSPCNFPPAADMNWATSRDRPEPDASDSAAILGWSLISYLPATCFSCIQPSNYVHAIALPGTTWAYSSRLSSCKHSDMQSFPRWLSRCSKENVGCNHEVLLEREQHKFP